MARPYPPVDIDAVARRRDRLMGYVCMSRLHVLLAGDDMHDFAVDLHRALPEDVNWLAVQNTVRQLAGKTLTPELALSLCWRIAGNLPALKAGHNVRPWTGLRGIEWVPAQITRAVMENRGSGRLGFRYFMRIWGGSPCGMTMEKFWTKRQCTVIAHHLGFTRWRGQRLFQAGEQFVGLRLVAKLELSDTSNSTQPMFWEFECPPGFLKYNREILDYRFRKVPCPNAWTHPCHNCAVGYDECPGGTHRKTYLEQVCPVCETESFFDPDVTMLHCVECTAKENAKVVSF